MEVKRYEVDEIRDNKELVSRISNFIKKTFADISNLYPADSVFKNEVTGDLGSTIQEADNTNVFYLIENTSNEILGCLWAIIKEDNNNYERALVNLFFLQYIGTDKESRKKGIASLLNKYFLKEAIEKVKTSKMTSVVNSRVYKNNIASQERHIRNGYVKYEEIDSPCLQFYKDFEFSEPNDEPSEQSLGE